MFFACLTVITLSSASIILFFPDSLATAVLFSTAEFFGHSNQRVSQTINVEPIAGQLKYFTVLAIWSIYFICIYKHQLHRYCHNLFLDLTLFWKEVTSYSSQLFHRHPASVYSFAIVFLLGFALRYLYLFEPIRHDEAYTYTQFAQRPLFLGLTQYYNPGNHLLHTLFVHFSTLLMGNEPWTIRLPTFLSGLALIPAVFLTFTRLFSVHVGLLTAALVASSSPLIEYSVNARGYSLQSLFFVLLIALATIVRNSENRAAWCAFSLTAVLGLATVPTTIYVYAMTVGWILFSALFDDSKLGLLKIVKLVSGHTLAIIFATAIFYWPVAVVSELHHELLSHLGGFGSSSIQLLKAVNYLQDLTLYLTRNLPGPMVFIFGMMAALSLFMKSTNRLHKHNFFLIAMLTFLCLYLLHPVYYYFRIWLFLTPLFLGATAYGIVAIGSHLTLSAGLHRILFLWIIPLGCFFLCSTFVFTSNGVRHATDTGTFLGGEMATRYITELTDTSDVVTTGIYSSANLRYYLDKLNATTKLTWSANEMASSHRIVIVVNTLYRENAVDLIEDTLFTTGLFSRPVLNAVFDHTEIYIMERQGDPINGNS